MPQQIIIRKSGQQVWLPDGKLWSVGEEAVFNGTAFSLQRSSDGPLCIVEYSLSNGVSCVQVLQEDGEYTLTI
ncbi:hypothetical protein CVU37_04850 [candidate division BRC1 bacterium HGW-BRC1-1]|jgi:hypothetical protein|nr:MAG: hypothetical protein CVU37_04850 [candidate division BRC1 bacterium HGW-BRC1-1]